MIKTAEQSEKGFNMLTQRQRLWYRLMGLYETKTMMVRSGYTTYDPVVKIDYIKHIIDYKYFIYGDIRNKGGRVYEHNNR